MSKKYPLGEARDIKRRFIRTSSTPRFEEAMAGASNSAKGSNARPLRYASRGKSSFNQEHRRGYNVPRDLRRSKP